MGRALLSTLGLLLCGAAVVAFCYAIYAMGNIGTCASGGAYVSARPCPAGTGLKIALIPMSVVGGLLGIAVYSAGVRWKRSSPIPLGILMWSFTFLGAAGSLAYAAWGPASSGADDRGVGLAAIVLLVIFVPLGLLPLLGGLLGRRRRRPAPPVPGVAASPSSVAPVAPGPAPAPATTVDVARLRAGVALSGAAPPADVISRLERLDGLRRSGAITDEEFARLKARLLDGG